MGARLRARVERNGCDATESWAILALLPTEPLTHTDAAAQHSYSQIMHPPDSDDSNNEELTDADLIEAIVDSTCINTVDFFWESAIQMMVSGTRNSLILFPDHQFRVFLTCDVDEAYRRVWMSAKLTTTPTLPDPPESSPVIPSPPASSSTVWVFLVMRRILTTHEYQLQSNAQDSDHP